MKRVSLASGKGGIMVKRATDTGRRGSGVSPRPSLRDVAKAAGVSAACASNVINRRRRQDDAIGRAVMSAVGQLGYRVNAIAANLRRTSSRLVGVVLPDFENPFFGALLAALERCAEESGYRLTPASSREDPQIEAREVAELLGWRVAGLLVAPTIRSPGPEAAVGGVPIVVVDRVFGHPDTDEIAADNTAAASEVTARLIGLGHRRILVAHSDPALLNVAERLRGVRAAAEAARLGGIAVETPLLECGPSLGSADRAFANLFSRQEVPGAIFALNNLAALAAYGAVQRRGMVPGRDLALVGFDDSAWMAHMHPAVAAVVQPVEAIARASWERLIARIEGRAGVPASLRIACRIEERGTLVPPSVKKETGPGGALPPLASGQQGPEPRARTGS
ncbi:MAG: LacI family DNA-binding transcriptional regulator [Paracoccaceae bacterium]